MNLKPVLTVESMNAGTLVNQEKAGECVSLANFHLYVVPVKAMFSFSVDGLWNQPYPRYSAILGTCAQFCYCLDMQVDQEEKFPVA